MLYIKLFVLPRDEYSSHGGNCSSSLRSGRITEYAEFSRRTDHVFICDGTNKCLFFFFFFQKFGIFVLIIHAMVGKWEEGLGRTHSVLRG